MSRTAATPSTPKLSDGSCSWRLVCTLVCLYVAICFAPHILAQVFSRSPQSANTDPDKTYSLTGTVINSVTGEPINRALVQVSNRAVMTDADGGFEVSGLLAGQYSVQGRKPGFFSDQELHPGRQPEYFITGTTNDPVVIKLTPQAVITGHITNVNGEALEGVPVALTSSIVQDGRRSWTTNNSTSTNDDGEFRLALLKPGQYFLSAGPALGQVFETFQPDRVKKGYAKTYYAGVPDRAEATPISIAAGQHSVADLSLDEVPLYQVAVRILGIAPSSPPGLQVLNSSGEQVSPFSMSFIPASGLYRLSLPSGAFKLEAFSQLVSNQNVQTLRASTQINVAADLPDVVMALAPSSAVPITIRVESGKADTLYPPNFHPNVNLRLIPENQPGNSTFSQREGPQGSALVVRDLEPGSYRVQVDNSFPGYVQSLRCGSQDLMREPLIVAPGQQVSPVEVVLRDDVATLSVTVRSDPSVRNAQVLLIGNGRPDSVRVLYAVTSSNGSSTFGELAPGDYTVYAFDDVSDLEFRNPDALSPYSAQAQHVTLSPNGKSNVVLDLIQREDR